MYWRLVSSGLRCLTISYCIFILFICLRYMLHSPKHIFNSPASDDKLATQQSGKPTAISSESKNTVLLNRNTDNLSVNRRDNMTDNTYITSIKALHRNLTFSVICEYRQYAKRSISLHSVEHSTMETSNIMDIPVLSYLPSYRSPCFQLKRFTNEVQIRCLPYFFMAGFPKCGTTDFYSKLKLHPLIATPNYKEPLYFSLGVAENKPFTSYVSTFSKASYRAQFTIDSTNKTFHPVVIGDFSTRELMMELHTWQANKAMTYDVIRHVLPCSKFIVLIRDPVERLYSDFIYFLKRQPELITAEMFHEHVTASFEWWKNCTEKFNIKQCLYGNPQLPGLKPLFQGDIYQCWLPNRICPNFRIGFYSYILQDWMKHFPKESFLILAMEHFSVNPVDIIQNHVLPFLGLPAMDQKLVKIIQNMARSYPFDQGPSGDVRKAFEERNIVKRMFPQTRQALEELYRDSNIKLAYL